MMGRGAKVAVMDGQRAKTFGSALAQARQRAELTQSQLSVAVGIPQSTISVWERGEIEPSPDAVFELERALRVGPGSLSRLLGFAPPTDAELAAHVKGVILADPRLDEYKRRLLLQIYDSMVGGND